MFVCSFVYFFWWLFCRCLFVCSSVCLLAHFFPWRAFYFVQWVVPSLCVCFFVCYLVCSFFHFFWNVLCMFLCLFICSFIHFFWRVLCLFVCSFVHFFWRVDPKNGKKPKTVFRCKSAKSISFVELWLSKVIGRENLFKLFSFKYLKEILKLQNTRYLGKTYKLLFFHVQKTKNVLELVI